MGNIVPHHCLLHSVTSGGAGSVPDGNVGTLCPSTVPSLLCHLCQDGTRMLRVPSWNRGTQPPVLCHLPGRSSFPAGTGAPCSPWPCHLHSITAGLGRSAFRRGCVSGLCPRSVCNQPRSRVRPGPVPAPGWSRGSGSGGSQSGERSPASGRGSGAGEVAPALGRDSSPGGHGDMARLLLLLLLAALGCAARPGRRPAPWDDGADGNSLPTLGPLPTGAGHGERPGCGAGLRGWVLLGAARGASPALPAQRPPARGCANLTLVLDNWKFAITSQLRNLLLSDHQTVLPDYGRIPALSGALDELYRDFRGLKEQLGRLSDRFAHLEASVEQLSRARGAAGPPRRGGVPQNPRRAPGTPP
ncbi:uncharacterized protein LOC128948450 isoform X1 [Melozone crissalis]|uniref:uncharacterized protein LOC128948450 isoform X1 n=1 Tax=Melozone crissalis TaxID=40204 RepID=UPI0023DA86CB|nr:uncharacterized protein LOC128948450 isoform X1 [Melozone crissalis]